MSYAERPDPTTARVCAQPECSRSAFSRGFCQMHYSRLLNGRPMDAPKRAKEFKPCSVEGCQNYAHSRGYCKVHYERWRKGSDMHAPMRRRIPAGEWYTDASHGYRKRNIPGVGHEYEHVVVMEQTLGRKLRDGENVHHRNGHRDDNRPENLELWSTKQPPGQRVEDKLSWAIEFICQYSDNDLVVQFKDALKRGEI